MYLCSGQKHTQRGFTLIEMVIVVAIVGLLAAIAYPSYQNQVIKSRRTDAKSALLNLSNQMEQYRYENNSYPASIGLVLPSTVSRGGHYQLAITAVNDTRYELSAQPRGAQVADTDCGAFTLDSTSERGVSGSRSLADCW